MFSTSQKQWARIMWNQGATGKTIAKRFQVSEATISNLKRDEGWESTGRDFQPEYHDIIRNCRQIVGYFQLEIINKKGRDCTEEVRNMQRTAVTGSAIEAQNFEVQIRDQMLSLEKHMEYLKTCKPFPQDALDHAQAHYDSLKEKLE